MAIELNCFVQFRFSGQAVKLDDVARLRDKSFKEITSHKEIFHKQKLNLRPETSVKS
jgi:hypothetical protein